MLKTVLRILGRIAAVLVVILVLVVALLHTGPVESMIWKRVEQEAAAAGVDLTAANMDLNLFDLKVTLFDVQLKHPRAEVRLAKVVIDFARGILSKQIDLERILVSDGAIRVLPAPAETPPPEPADREPFVMPPVRLGEAVVEDVALYYNDSSAALDVGLTDLLFNYRDGAFQAGLQTQPTEVSKREIPVLKLDLSGRSADFTSFSDLDLKVTSPGGSEIGVTGEVSVGFKPNLNYRVSLAEDLLPEAPGLRAAGALKDTDLSLDLNVAPQAGGQTWPVNLSTRLDLAAKPLLAPVTAKIGDLAELKLDLSLDEDLNGVVVINGLPAGVNGLHPLLKTESLTVQADFSVPGLKPEQARAKAQVTTTGTPALNIQAVWADNALTFSGLGAPLPVSQLSFSGSYRDGLQVEMEGMLNDLNGLDDLAQIPAELCGGPIVFDGAFAWGEGRWRVDNLTVKAFGVAYASHFEDDLILYLDGPDNALGGKLYSQTLNPSATALEFLLDAVERQWLGLELQLSPPQSAYEDYQYRLGVRASGEGPMLEPNLSGWVEAHVDKDGAVLDLDADFSLQDRRLRIPNLVLDSHHASLTGEVVVLLEEALDWQVDLVLGMSENPEYVALVPAELPELDLNIEGGRAGLLAEVDIPQQTYVFQESGLALGTPRGGSAVMTPDSRSLEGGIPRLEVAGVGLSQIDFKIDQGQLLHVKTDFKLDEPQEFAQAFAKMLPPDLTLDVLSGRVDLTTDLNFKNPRVRLEQTQAVGSFRESPFELAGVGAAFADGLLRVDDLTTSFAGVDLAVSQAPYRDPDQPTFLAVKTAFEIVDDVAAADLKVLAADMWPQGLELYHAAGELELASAMDMSEPRLDFLVADLDAVFQDKSITVQNMRGWYDDGIWLEPQEINLGEVAVRVQRRDKGFLLTAQINADDIGDWVEGFAGDAVFDIAVGVSNLARGLALNGSLQQKSGNLVLLDPWMELADWSLVFETDESLELVVRDGKGKLNNGLVTFSGGMDLGESRASEFDLFAENINLDMADLQADVTSAVEWRSNGQENKLAGTVLLNEAFYSTDIQIEDLISSLTGQAAELNFPNPVLEAVELQLTVLTDKPLIVEAPFAFMEIETPSLLIQGNLAEPKPFAGPLNINQGSSFDLGKQTFVFDAGSIQFYPNRPGDPFLQLSMEANDYGQRKPLVINNYLSELDQSLGGQGLFGIMANFMLGKVSSLVSIEGELSETVFDSSFTFVVSQPISDKVVTRYAVPLVDQQKNQRFELTIGPYRNNLFSLARQNEIHSGIFRHIQKFGYYKNKRPPDIRKITFSSSDGEITRKLKRRFKLKRDNLFTRTLWRRAELDLTRYLKERGYLTPQITHAFEDRKLSVDITFGPQTTLTVTGLEVSEKDKRRILGRLRPLDAAGMRYLAGYMERLAVSRGFPSAAAFPVVEENQLAIEVLLGNPMESININFGEAQPLLAEQFKDPQVQKAFLGRYIIADSAMESMLRARLAAMGYLLPQIEPGYFEDESHFRIAIQPGPRGVLSKVVVNDEVVNTELVGQPFEYAMIAQTAAALGANEGKDSFIDIQPRREGANVFFEVKRVEIEEPVIDTLTIEGEARIAEEKIKRFVGFKPGMELSDLIKGQQALMGAGPYEFARVQSNEKAAILEVGERNRFDVDYNLTWDEENQFGGAIQFSDNLLFHDFIQWQVKAEYNAALAEVLTGIDWQRPWGLPVDVRFNVEWLGERDDAVPDVLFDAFGVADVRSATTPERREANLSISYPLTVYQQLNFGFRYQENFTEVRTEVYDPFFAVDPDDLFQPENIIDVFVAKTKTRATPLRLAWAYRRFDHPVDPKNGLLVSIGIDHYNKALGTTEAFEGNRINTKLSGLWTFGPISWLQRYELGWYKLETPSFDRPEILEGSPFFVLGGNTTVRGFNRDFLGPLDATRDLVDGETLVSVHPIGGEAMAFFSHEFNYNTGFYNIGVSPFVDGGFVWSSNEDLFEHSLVISAGLGLTLATPLGTLRVDWADPVEDKVFQDQLEFNLINEDEREQARSKAFTNWSLRFGRVF